MPEIESLLARWQSAGVLDSETAARIRSYEAEHKKPAGLCWQGIVALILGAILLATGVILFVSAHWDELGPGSRFALVLAMVSVFHIGGALSRESFRGLSTALHAVGTVSTGAAIALVGQIFNIQEHWPGAILLWALAALAGWALLRDQAQQTLALLLVPAWIFSELDDAMNGQIGQSAFLGRFLFVWALLYLTVFLGSRHRAVQGILFAAGAIASVAGTVMMIEGWRSWSSNQTAVPFWPQCIGWMVIACLPLAISLRNAARSLIPVAAAIVLTILLPWTQHSWVEHYNYGRGQQGTYTVYGPNLLAHALVSGFCIFTIWWGVRQASRMLVNLGIAAFAISVFWFYFSNIFDKIGRSLGLIGLGVLFLAGGWVLERMRRRLLASMTPQAAREEGA
ncbi:DUF2157 domain-containing protein [Terracidiphilus gabretensis]|uniref:DUF2157 domain-containing protein n=1 Tax=Terracidiphilus gabretensis TaxID=1577687 RepID=UPI00071B8BC8|nr:DUF2157 domain-containing protein [Terracidiphilus gabretensis]